VRRFEKVLVANRGEIARRVLRTLREMGIASAAVYSDADWSAPFVAEADEAVRLGPAPAAESYLSVDRVLGAARRVGADAVHPGYGFLAENADFAARCAEAGLAFIGPPVDVLRRMGSKIEAKQMMEAAGVPVIPGAPGAGLSDRELAAAARRLGFPVLVKASAGGGGKGMRIVREESALAEAVAAARRESASAFGDDTLLLERYFEAPRHIEVQIVGDGHGHVLHCFERECSVQRRYQKVVEEAPSVAVDPALRHRLGQAAVSAGKAIGYVGAGTVEFLVDAAGAFYFLEVNPRLQVEHPVTEAVTGLDLVRLQILVAQGLPLPVTQEDLQERGIDGHAIEVRLYAEDPDHDFLPATGTVALWDPAPLPGVRVDSGIAAGTEVGVHYDPLLAKIIAHGSTRAESLRRLVGALRRLGVGGVVTNRDFLLAVLTHPAFEAGELDTHFVERHLPPSARRAARDPQADRLHAVATALWACRRRVGTGPLPASIPPGWRGHRGGGQEVSYRVAAGDLLSVRYAVERDGSFAVEAGGASFGARIANADEDGIDLELDGLRRRVAVDARGLLHFARSSLGATALEEVPRFAASAQEELAGACVAPMPGVVRDVRAAVGDRVAKGAVLLILEAMKMEHELIAHVDGVVAEVRVAVGDMVEHDALLVVVEAADGAGAAGSDA
jgi:propionyl-CoA carboxylase alpha chain